MRVWAVLTAGALVHVLVVGWAANRLARDDVPLQFDASGAVTHYGSQAQALALAVVPGVLMLAIGVGLVLLARHGPLRMVNIPHRAYWLDPRREPELRRMLADDIALVIASTLVFLALIPVWIVIGTQTDGAGLTPAVFGWPIGIYLVGTLTWSVWLSRRRYRPRPD